MDSVRLGEKPPGRAKRLPGARRGVPLPDPEFLQPISGKCWRPAYEAGKWSNVLCSHDARVLGALTGLAVGAATSQVTHRT